MAREQGFGYLPPPPDGRNHRYLGVAARAQLNEQLGAKPTPRKRAYNEGPRLNQGRKPHCVGYSVKGFLNAAPIMSKHEAEPTADQLYFTAQEHDEWPGRNYEGSSVRGGCEAGRVHGVVESYAWFRSGTEAAEWTNGGYGTIIIGTYWYPQMDDVDGKGFMQMPGSLATPIGGHAYRVNWFDKAVGGWLVVNSWGFTWGIRKRDGTLTGTAYMTMDAFEQLCFREEGECAAPTQLRIKPVRVA